MNYIPLDQYKKAWVFRHKDLPVNDADLAKIKPMSETRAAALWTAFVSKQSDHPEFFHKGDWANSGKTWLETDNWQKAWEDESPDLPEFISNHFDWDPNTVVYFCYERTHVLETTWDVFKRNWKNFLFMDDGPLLIGKKRKQVAQFLQNGNAKIGLKE